MTILTLNHTRLPNSHPRLSFFSFMWSFLRTGLTLLKGVRKGHMSTQPLLALLSDLEEGGTIHGVEPQLIKLDFES